MQWTRCLHGVAGTRCRQTRWVSTVSIVSTVTFSVESFCQDWGDKSQYYFASCFNTHSPPFAGRAMLGETNPLDSKAGSIRGDYCIDLGRNICHGSDSVDSAEKEIALWFDKDQVRHTLITWCWWISTCTVVKATAR